MTGLGSSSISKLKEDIVEIKKDEEWIFDNCKIML